MNYDSKIMTIEHPRWNEFAHLLGGPDGCDFRDDSDKFRCGGPEKPLASKALRKMGDFDLESTFRYFDKSGGFCDCEILFNVDLLFCKEMEKRRSGGAAGGLGF